MNVWSLARQLAATLAEGITGWSWRPGRTCPQWCLGGHHCTASWRSGGEHRSAPVTFHGEHGVMVVTGVQSSSGQRAIEVRLRIAERAAEHLTMR